MCRAYIKLEKERERGKERHTFTNEMEKERKKDGETERMETLQSAMYPDYD